MRLAEVMGQKRVVDALQRSITTNRVAHAYLFEGISGCGRRTTALALISALFCQQPSDGDACGRCSSCKKLAAGSHPDLHLLQPLPDKRDISIEQVRELQQMLSLRPFEAKRKACLIEPAERMSLGAANSLLKTLEEPPGHAVMILLATQADRLLPTIRSRCQHLRFAPLAVSDLVTLLERQGVEPSVAATLAPLSEGSLEQAREVDSEAAAASRQELLGALRQVRHQQVATVFDASERLAGSRDETLGLFSLLISLLRDMILLRSAAMDRITNLFLQDQLAEEAARFHPADLMEALELALEIRRSIQGNVNAKLALDRFLLRYSRLRTT
ncbi:MAG: DNA polymerase III subunit delta' [Trichlorobacter sp.]|jgi:DNA polymerase-3 subunit delta'